ncbi:hypothetical protein DL93DRAFT_2234178 [Clavulina sp. PMI_390]|nr:hypothetical protein DL93DRAFT_2234178 [Clavulina sp. PMI_390]
MDQLIAVIAQNTDTLTALVKKLEGVGSNGFASSLVIATDLESLNASMLLLIGAIAKLDIVKSIISHNIHAQRAVDARRRNSLQPIMKLPLELLLEILELKAPKPQNTWLHRPSPVNDPASSWEWSDIDYESFRRHFGATSTDFRSVSLMSKKAWSLVSLRACQKDRLIPSWCWEELLHRSTPSPFHLKIEYDGSHSIQDIVEHSEALKQHLPRCHSVLISWKAWRVSCLHKILDLRKLLNLKEFIFYGISSLQRYQIPGFTGLIPISWPGLKTLAICNRPDENDPESSSDLEDFVQEKSLAVSLTRLRINGPYDANTILSFLTECVQLEHFEWSCSKRPKTTSIVGPEAEVLPMLSLRSLSIPGEASLYSFPPIEAPLLDTICLGHDVDLMIDDDLSHHPCAVFHPKQPYLVSLKRLMFDPGMYTSSAISKFLLLHHSIEEIYLDNTDVPELESETATILVDTLNALASSHPAGALVHANLKRLRINLCGKQKKSPQRYEMVINTLQRVQEVLKKVRIQSSHDDWRVKNMFLRVGAGHTHSPYEIDESWPRPWSLCELSVMGLSGGWRRGERANTSEDDLEDDPEDGLEDKPWDGP